MSKNRIHLIGFLGLLSLFSAQAMSAEKEECDRPTPTQVEKLFDRWNTSLQTLNPDAVVANYEEEATLLPTLSNQMRDDPLAIRDYFVHFLQKNPVGRIDSRDIQVGCNFAVDTGLYTFTLQDKDGKKHDVAARYTFVYEKTDGRWLIASHHSSAMPIPTKLE